MVFLTHWFKMTFYEYRAKLTARFVAESTLCQHRATGVKRALPDRVGQITLNY